VQLERLHPEPGAMTPGEAVTGLDLAALAPRERPYLVLNMVATLDGKATIEGRTRAMSTDADREIFHHLRTQVDAVLVGAGTVRAERYGAITKSDELREKRRREGVRPDALACIVSGRLDLPSDLPLLGDPESEVLIATAARDRLEEPAARVEYLRSDGDEVDLPAVLERLRRDHGVRSILCEGGPTLNYGLFRGDLVDELFLTLSSKLTGGAHALTIVAGEGLPEPLDLELVSLLRCGEELFARYRVRR